jgi:hypothetical protein
VPRRGRRQADVGQDRSAVSDCRWYLVANQVGPSYLCPGDAMQLPGCHEYGKLSWAGAGVVPDQRRARSEHVTINANCRSDNLKPAPLAQSAERLHGKEKVYGSIP